MSFADIFFNVDMVRRARRLRKATANRRYFGFYPRYPTNLISAAPPGFSMVPRHEKHIVPPLLARSLLHLRSCELLNFAK